MIDKGVQGQGSHLGSEGHELQDMILVMQEAHGKQAIACHGLRSTPATCRPQGAPATGELEKGGSGEHREPATAQRLPE